MGIHFNVQQNKGEINNLEHPVIIPEISQWLPERQERSGLGQECQDVVCGGGWWQCKTFSADFMLL